MFFIAVIFAIQAEADNGAGGEQAPPAEPGGKLYYVQDTVIVKYSYKGTKFDPQTGIAEKVEGKGNFSFSFEYFACNQCSGGPAISQHFYREVVAYLEGYILPSGLGDLEYTFTTDHVASHCSEHSSSTLCPKPPFTSIFPVQFVNQLTCVCPGQPPYVLSYRVCGFSPWTCTHATSEVACHQFCGTPYPSGDTEVSGVQGCVSQATPCSGIPFLSPIYVPEIEEVSPKPPVVPGAGGAGVLRIRVF